MRKAWIATVFSFLIAVSLLAGCQNTKEKDTDISQENIEKKSLEDIYTEITNEVELPEMVTLNDNYIANYFGIDLSKLEEYIFVNAQEVIYADTIIIMKVKDTNDIDTMKEALETMIEHKKSELENYLPEQFKIVEKSEIKTSDSYIYLIISNDAQTINGIIEKYISQGERHGFQQHPVFVFLFSNIFDFLLYYAQKMEKLYFTFVQLSIL